MIKKTWSFSALKELFFQIASSGGLGRAFLKERMPVLIYYRSRYTQNTLKRRNKITHTH